MAVQPRIKRIMLMTLKVVGVALLVAAAAGFVYEEVGRRQNRKRLPHELFVCPRCSHPGTRTGALFSDC